MPAGERRLYTAREVAVCRSCGFAMPWLDMCRVAKTCVDCARKILGSECDACSDRDVCDVAVEGIKFLKSIERKLDVFIDMGRYIAEQLERYDRVELGIAFLKCLMGLAKLLQRERSERALPLWLATVLRESVISELARVPYVVRVDLSQPLKDYCAEFNCRGLEPVLNNLLNVLVSLSLVEGRRDPRYYFRLGA
jgi:hypothetical protein